MNSTQVICNDYVKVWRPIMRKDADHYAAGSLKERILRAALAEGRDQKKNKHQWRIPIKVLENFSTKLLGIRNELEGVKSFKELHELIEREKIYGIGPVTVYDTAERIGLGQNIHPEEVYIHAGVRIGVKNLGIHVQGKSIPLTKFPLGFKGLSASEIEKDYLGPNGKPLNPQSGDQKRSSRC